ncbi:hypothetical protein BDW74DRAFT_73680 [Aspergillus multicolor]|uniref:zinc finger CCCH domain-containing protein n=1 Tax=Aspergillus multicolor TaxID=41759 RepID=UPI003CCCC388
MCASYKRWFFLPTPFERTIHLEELPIVYNMDGPSATYRLKQLNPKHPSSLSQVSCRFYLRGVCRNGDKCRFSHSRETREVATSQSYSAHHHKFHVGSICKALVGMETLVYTLILVSRQMAKILSRQR